MKPKEINTYLTNKHEEEMYPTGNSHMKVQVREVSDGLGGTCYYREPSITNNHFDIVIVPEGTVHQSYGSTKSHRFVAGNSICLQQNHRQVAYDQDDLRPFDIPNILIRLGLQWLEDNGIEYNEAFTVTYCEPDEYGTRDCNRVLPRKNSAIEDIFKKFD